MKVNKITQPQIRILRHELGRMARDARDAAQEDFQQNKARLERDLQRIADRLLVKHRKALMGSITAEVSTWHSINVSIRTSCDSAAHEAYRAEFKAAVTKAGLDGITDDTSYIYFPALGMTDRHGSNGPLSVPTPQKAKWERLAREIDMAFMSGDAASLLHIIETFAIGD